MLVEIGDILSINPQEIIYLTTVDKNSKEGMEGHKSKILLKNGITTYTALSYETCCELLAVAKIPDDVKEKYVRGDKNEN